MKIKIPRNMKRIEKPLGFTLMEVFIAIMSVGALAVSVYIIYLIIMALRKYINS